MTPLGLNLMAFPNSQHVLERRMGEDWIQLPTRVENRSMLLWYLCTIARHIYIYIYIYIYIHGRSLSKPIYMLYGHGHAQLTDLMGFRLIISPSLVRLVIHARWVTAWLGIWNFWHKGIGQRLWRWDCRKIRNQVNVHGQGVSPVRAWFSPRRLGT